MKPDKQVVDMLERDFEGRVREIRDEFEEEAIMSKQIRTSREFQFRDAMRAAVMMKVANIIELLYLRDYEGARSLCCFTEEGRDEV